MNRFTATIALSSIVCSPALAFDNIEADVLYDQAIKQQIMIEFSQGLKIEVVPVV